MVQAHVKCKIDNYTFTQVSMEFYDYRQPEP
jgi:hypothetical protein